jgi:glycosyltransferase involved in cell wall biosynthesis
MLILLHCESNTGYAIAPLEGTFFRMAMELCDQDRSRIHFGYPSMRRGPTETLPADFNQYLVIDPQTRDPEDFRRAQAYVEKHGIDTLFGFDQPVSQPIYKHFRAGGVRHFISYWGAPMSSLFGPVKLAIKRIEVALRRHGPDHYIFESVGMADTAVLGRGIARSKTSVVYQDVDADRFRPEPGSRYVYEKLNIPASRRVFFYAGHFEERKGVAVIMRAINRLARERTADDWHMVLFGNQPGEEQRFIDMLAPEARERVLFGGYRNDLHLIQRSCYAGMIASTGWDSFPRSGMEIQASGMPLLASALPGLRESVDHEHTGYLFEPGDDRRLAELMNHLLDHPDKRDELAKAARARIEQGFSHPAQLRRLIDVVRRTTAS